MEREILDSEAVYFYIFSICLLLSAVGVVFSPKMFMSVIALFGAFLFSSLIYGMLGAYFMAVFQFVLCGLFLCFVFVLIMRKITKWNLPLKIAPFYKILLSSIVFGGFGIVVYFYVFFEFNGMPLDFFDFIKEKSVDIVDFSGVMLPVYLIIILIPVMCVLLRNIYLTNTNENEEDKDV